MLLDFLVKLDHANAIKLSVLAAYHSPSDCPNWTQVSATKDAAPAFLNCSLNGIFMRFCFRAISLQKEVIPCALPPWNPPRWRR